MGISLGYLLVQILNFGIMFVVIRAWIVAPITDMLDRRREAIAQGLEDARVAAEARANAEKEAERIIAQAQLDASHKVRESTERAEQLALEIKGAAEQEANNLREEAIAEAEAARDQTLGELRGQVAALAIAAAQKLVGAALDEQRQRALLADFFSGLKEGKIEVLEGERLAGSSAEITSALPLTEDEQATIRQQVSKQLDSGATLTFKIDPSILGGLVIRVGDKVLDGSVSAKLEGLRQTLH
jgi:F-type H+-transporting ATPase subunit b